MTSRLRAIFFDLGGTLFSNRDIPGVNAPILVEAGRRLGLERGLNEIGIAYVQAAREVNAVYMRRPYYLHRDHFHDTYRVFAKRFGREPTDEFLHWFYAAQRDSMLGGLKLRDDCVETLHALRARRLTLSIVSNIDDDYLDGMLQSLQLEALFDHWISSEAAASCKPDAKIFTEALRQADCRAEEVIFVGDSRVHDVQGAGALGMTTVLLSEDGGGSHLDDEDFEARPDLVIASLSELIEIVDARPR